MSAPPTRGRARRIAGIVGSGVVLVLVFVVALVVGVLLQLDSPVARRVVAAEVNAVLGSQFEGSLQLEQLGRLGLNGIAGARIVVRDPEGVEVLYLDGVQIQVSFVALARSAVLGKGDIGIVASRIAVDQARINLDSDAKGALRIANAFTPRPTPAKPAAKPSDPPGRGVMVRLEHVDLAHAWAHGTMSGAPTIDADIDDLHGSLSVVSDRVSVDIGTAKIATRGLPRDANVDALVTAKVELPSAAGNDVGLAATLRGTAGHIPLTADATMDGDRIDGVVDVPTFATDRLRALLPEVPVYGNVAVHAEAHGSLPRIDAAVQARLDDGTIDATSVVTLGNDVAIEANVDARAIDVRSFAPTAPASSLSATVQSGLTLHKDGSIVGDYVLAVARGRIGNNDVPSAALTGSFSQRTNARGQSDLAVHGQGTVAEVGAPTALSFDLHPDGSQLAVDFDVDSAVELGAFARIGSIGTGHARVHARGRVTVPDVVLDVTADGAVDSLVIAPARVAHGVLSGHVRGPLKALAIDGAVVADDVSANGLVFSRVAADAHGAMTQLEVAVSAVGPNAPKIQARSTLDLADVPTLHAARISAARDDVTMIATIESARLAAGDLRVDGVVVEGLGQPVHAQLRHTRASTMVRADSRGLDLVRLGRLLRVDKAPVNGQGSFDVDVTITGSTIAGRIISDFTHLSLPQVSPYIDDVSLHADASMEGRRVSGHVRASSATIGYVDVTTVNAELAGSAPIAVDSWKEVWGAAQIFGQVDLPCVVGMLPKGTLPIDDISGTLILRGRVARDSIRDTIPELALTLSTRNLTIAAGGAPTRPPRASDAASWTLSGIDVRLDAKVDGQKGSADLIVRLIDAKGEIFGAEAKSASVPFPALLSPGSDPFALLIKTPIVANGEVHRRRLDSFQAFLPTHGAQGDIEASFGFAGTVAAPKIEVFAKAWDVKDPAAPITMKMGADVVAHYDGAKLDAEAAIHSPKAVVLTANAHGTMNIADVLFPKPGVDIPWTASADVHAVAFPLGAVSALSERQIRGKLTGDVKVTDLHLNARARLEATIADLQLGSAKLSGAKLSADIDDTRLRASARLDQTDGYLRASAALGVKWGSNVVPARDASVKTQASLDASRFRISALLPFLDIFSDLDGRLDARIGFDQENSTSSPHLHGSATLSDGLFQLASMGEEYHGVTAKVSVEPNGVARLDNAVAYGVTGRVTASASAHLDGLDLVDAQAAVRIAKKEALPLEVNGSAVGDVYGSFDVKANMSADKRKLAVAVEVPVLHLKLPDQSSRTVQTLDEPTNTRIGYYDRARHQFRDLPIDGEDLNEAKPTTANDKSTEIDVTVRLGNDILVERGTGLKVALGGNVNVKVAGTTQVTGQIQLIRGSVDVQGKPFEIERGVVTFVGDDPSNPEVVITAGWTAPDGTRINADFTGTVKTGKVTLRSSPPRPNNEILALIMFGTANGSSATPYAQPTSDGAVAGSAAAGAAGGTVTQGLNRALDSITGLAITTKIDTSQPNPRPEVELQVAKNVSLQVAIVLGTPPPGTNQDLTYVTMEWRFAPKWSLATTFGDKGSSIGDVVWQYRY